MNPSDKNNWNLIVVAWVLIWFSTLVALIFYYGIEKVAAASLLLVPFIICGFGIPLIVFYNRSTISLSYLKDRLLAMAPKISQERPKIIHYFCLIMIPFTFVFFLSLIAYPGSFLQYGQKYNENYSYNLAIIQFLYLIAYFGYWKVKKWGFYLFLFALALRVWLLNFRLDIPISIHYFTYDIYVIIIGIIFIQKKQRG